jgi:hypothetical protein
MTSLLLLLATALAEDHRAAAEAGSGGIVVANPTAATTVALNPANMGLSERYDVVALFAGHPDGDLRWGISAIDARTSPWLTFGVAYMGSITRPPFLPAELPGWWQAGETPINRKERHDITFAAAGTFFERKLSVGLNGTVMVFRDDFGGRGTTGNLDLAAATRPIPELVVGLTARDVLPVPGQEDRPATIAAGVWGGRPELFSGGVEFDARLEPTVGSRFDVRAGVDGVIKELASLRAGWDWDGARDIHRLSLGFGLRAPRGTLDYAVRIPLNLDAVGITDVQHVVSITLYIPDGEDEAREEEPFLWEDDRPARGGRRR